MERHNIIFYGREEREAQNERDREWIYLTTTIHEETPLNFGIFSLLS